MAVFLTCHRGAGGRYRSVSKLGLLINIWIATSCWPFLLCFILEHIVHLSRCDMLPGLFGHAVCTMHCWSIYPVPVPSGLITMHTSTTVTIANKSTDRTSSPRYKIMLPLLRHSPKLWANRGALRCNRKWELSCRLLSGKMDVWGEGSVTDSLAVHSCGIKWHSI